MQELHFQLEDGTAIPKHFHVTELGQINKNLLIVEGVIRDEKVINFQLWYSVDEDHRLEAENQ